MEVVLSLTVIFVDLHLPTFYQARFFFDPERRPTQTPDTHMLLPSENARWDITWLRSVTPKAQYNDKTIDAVPMLPREALPEDIVMELRRDYKILLAVKECLVRGISLKILIRDIAAFYESDQTERSTNQAIAYVMRKLMDKLAEDVAAGLLSGNGCVHWPLTNARGTDGQTELTLDDRGRETLKAEIDLWLDRMQRASIRPALRNAILSRWKPSRSACNAAGKYRRQL